MTASATERFDLSLVVEHFERSIADSVDDVDTDMYLNGYRELNKFFSMMGTVFGFVSKDVAEKMDILAEFRQRMEDADRFKSFSSSLTYEKQSGLLKKTDYVSASRTLLRLHRGLGDLLVLTTFVIGRVLIPRFSDVSRTDFIRVFLGALGELQPNDKTHTCCQIAYNQTLAAHHSWLIRKGAVMAMYTMPTRDQLLGRVCLDVPAAIECLPRMLDVTRQVFERTDALYTLHDLHSLP